VHYRASAGVTPEEPHPIPYDQPSVHRRVSRTAIDEFIASRAARRRAELNALAETADPDVPDEYVTTR